MTITPELTGWTGLRFFGRTTASVSHELKNALAIIKENAGLLNDYLLMVEKGTPLKPERLTIVANRIDQQTRRADTLIKHLNRFGHSVDEAVTSVDLNEAVALLAALTLREVSMKQATLRLLIGESPVAVKTAPFWLLTLLGHCMTFALEVMGSGKVIAMHVSKTDDGALIRFEQLDGMPAMAGETFPGESETALLRVLGASCHLYPEEGFLVVKVSNC